MADAGELSAKLADCLSAANIYARLLTKNALTENYDFTKQLKLLTRAEQQLAATLEVVQQCRDVLVKGRQ